MANLRANKIYGTSGPDGNGSALFNGTDYLTAANATAFRLNQGSGEDFTIEAWIYAKSGGDGNLAGVYHTSGNQRSYLLYLSATNELKFNYASSGTAGSVSTLNAGTIPTNEWVHVAITNDTSATTARLFKNGLLKDDDTSAHTTYYANTSGNFEVGKNFDGYISNLHINKGTCKYTASFDPYKQPIEVETNTSVLCCNSSIDVLNDDKSNSFAQTASGGVKPTPDMPFNRSDAGVVFDGDIKMNSQGYMYFPTGDTSQRGRGRGVIFGGYSSPNGYEKDIYYLEIQSMGNAVHFGDLSATRYSGGGCASATRALIGGGRDGPSTNRTNTIEYVTIATTSNVLDFGDLTGVNAFNPGGGNQTRGIWMGGSTPTTVDTIEYVTIASTGNATDFGNLRAASYAPATAASPTRMLAMGGGNPSSFFAYIDYVTISTTGNASDFGDMTTARNQNTGVSSNTRAVAMGGAVPSTLSNAMEFVTIASTGDATDFGDLSSGFEHTGSVNNSIRGVQTGGRTPSYVNTLESITIASTGNSSDFGDIPRNNLGYTAGASDSHGGLE